MASETLGCRDIGDSGGMGDELSPGRRMEIIGFSPAVSGESVSGFCRRVGISRASYYRVRRVADEQGQARALAAASRAPRTPVRRWGADTDAAITRIRRDLEAQGKEPGAWSVWWVLSQGGSRQAPSRSTIARSCMERISSAGRNRAAFIHTLPLLTSSCDPGGKFFAGCNMILMSLSGAVLRCTFHVKQGSRLLTTALAAFT